jgi:uncharacterized protein (DUF1501 family)
MKRRNFIKNTVASAFFTPVLIDGIEAQALDYTSPFLRALMQVTGVTDRVLIVIQLNGGNDGLNTVIPLDQLSDYNKLRANIALPENKVLKLNGVGNIALHPIMTGMQRLYNEGKLVVIQGVSYPQPNFSHFRASDIWFTGGDSNQQLTTGWAGRYLQNRFQGFPDAYPNPMMPDPLAIQIGYTVSTALLGSSVSTGTVIQNPDTFARLIGDKPNIAPSDVPNTYAGKQVAFLRQQQISAVGYAAQIKNAATKATNKATYPTQNSLADQLKIVARLIAGGLQTKIYYVSIGGFDTHAEQVAISDNTTGAHAELLKDVSDAIASFQSDIEQLGMQDNVVGMTFSEFGRRANSNLSKGTDHGTSAPMFVFGKNVRGSVIGKTSSLTDLENGNLKMQYDFRQIYASVLTDWFGTDKATASTILQRDFATLPIFFSGAVTGFRDRIMEVSPLLLYPNPASNEVMIDLKDISIASGIARVFDITGREVIQKPLSNTNLVSVDVSQLQSGRYVVRVESGKKAYSGALIVVH